MVLVMISIQGAGHTENDQQSSVKIIHNFGIHAVAQYINNDARKNFLLYIQN